MIKKIVINGVHTEVSEDLKKYIYKKIGKLDKYLPLHARKSAHVEVKLKEKKIKAHTDCMAEVILHLPKEIITSKETTVNLYAAIDVTEEKIKNQIKKYKSKHGAGRIHQRVLARIKRRSAKLRT
ncbi:ribosome-associated translation inhibitor RaiA [Candidatus Saccharibacteria bacterium]|nr:ribosome-associated translation inhibitor RaiA [Candidatus Saccharibacteria bacterium]